MARGEGEVKEGRLAGITCLQSSYLRTTKGGRGGERKGAG